MKSVTIPRWAIVGLACVGLLSINLVGFSNVSQHERSDRFWSSLSVNGVPAEEYASLDALKAGADAVVVATFASLSAGRVFGAPLDGVAHPEEAQVFFADARLRVLQRISGKLRTDADGLVRLELLLPQRESLDALAANVPTERTLLFLRNKGVDAARQGRPLTIQERDKDYYRRVTDYAFIREVGGTAHLWASDEAGAFLDSLEGKSFDSVLSLVASS